MEELETCVKSSPRGGYVSHDLTGGGNPPQANKRTKPKLKKAKVNAVANRLCLLPLFKKIHSLIVFSLSQSVTCRRGRVQSAPTCSDNGLAMECLPRPTPGVHYRLNMGHLPFILGSVSPYLWVVTRAKTTP